MIKIDDLVDKLVLNNMCKEDKEIVGDGLTMGLEVGAMIITIIILGLYFNLVFEGLLFFISFSAIRTYAGEYHSENGIICCLSSSAIMLVFFKLIKFLSIEQMSTVVIVLLLTALAIILKFAPISTKNNPFDDSTKKYFRKKVIRNLFFESIIVFLLFGLILHRYEFVINTAILVSSILSEVPEMFGAETILMNRCIDENKFNTTVDLINNFKDYFKNHNQTIYENPSPGNKKGGITTLEDKSLGCTQKGGTAPVVDVIKYGDVCTQKGLNLLEGPGNDIVACTVLSAAGANIVLFTTGRGTPLGAPTPTIKIASNHELFINKKNWCDFDASKVLGEKDLDTLGIEFLDYVLKIASGNLKTCNEINDYREIAILKDGVTL